jgi:hypothetical protein
MVQGTSSPLIGVARMSLSASSTTAALGTIPGPAPACTRSMTSEAVVTSQLKVGGVGIEF